MPNAHELWLAPQHYTAAAGQPIIADIKIGQEFIGDGLLYWPEKIAQLGFVTEQGIQPITGQMGDRPAIQTSPIFEGQNILLYQTKPEKLLYRNFEKFAAFIDEKRQPHILDDHTSRNLPKTDFVERYMRFAKSLLLRGDITKGPADNYTGMPLEWVMQKHSEQISADGQMVLRLYYQGQPLKKAPITIFDKSEGQVRIKKTATDDAGDIHLKLEEGYTYLIDHVLIRPTDPNQNPQKAVWESLWASFSFAWPHS